MRKGKKSKDLKEFEASLREGLKYARGKKAKVKVEEFLIRDWKFTKPSTKVAVEIRRGVKGMKNGKVKVISSKKLIKHLKKL